MYAKLECSKIVNSKRKSARVKFNFDFEQE